MVSDPVEVVRRFMDAAARYHAGALVAKVLRFVAEDVVWYVPGDNATVARHTSTGSRDPVAGPAACCLFRWLHWA